MQDLNLNESVINDVKKEAVNLASESMQDAFDALYQELEKGIRSMKNDEVYTVEEAWKEMEAE